MNLCPWCLTEIKKPATLPAHYVQYHKTDKYGPPLISGNTFVLTKKTTDGVHGCTVWLISGEGTPKRYFLEYYFVVDQVSETTTDDPDFNFVVRGKRGKTVRPRVALDEYAWFQELRARLADSVPACLSWAPEALPRCRSLPRVRMPANKSLQTDRGPCCVSELFSSARAAAAELCRSRAW